MKICANPVALAMLAQRVTVGLHCIMPDVLDAYWLFCVARSRIAAPLVLRSNVPCAGTALSLPYWLVGKTPKLHMADYWLTNKKCMTDWLHL